MFLSALAQTTTRYMGLPMEGSMWPGFVFWLVLGYLLGSIPFGLILTRAAGLGDVRKIGSGNIGATNVLRTGHKGLAAATLLLDALKGTAAVLIGKFWHFWPLAPVATDLLADTFAANVAPVAMLTAGFGAFIGHLYPVWLRFKGGKGVATYIGVLFGLSWPAGLAFCAIWIGCAWLTRYSSLAALFASGATPAVLVALGGGRVPVLALTFTVMTLLLFWRHRENIRRLIAGTESRIGSAKSAPPSSAT